MFRIEKGDEYAPAQIQGGQNGVDGIGTRPRQFAL